MWHTIGTLPSKRSRNDLVELARSMSIPNHRSLHLTCTRSRGIGSNLPAARISASASGIRASSCSAKRTTLDHILQVCLDWVRPMSHILYSQPCFESYLDEPAILTGSTAATHHPWTHLNLDGSRIFRSIRTPAAYFDWIDGTQAVPDV